MIEIIVVVSVSFYFHVVNHYLLQESNSFKEILPLSDPTDRNGALKASFWSVFNPGNPDYVGDNCTFEGHEWTHNLRTVGLSMWAIFQLINIVVLLNLCVALMNKTIGKLSREKDSVWKMNRADAWMMFFNQKDFPIPFNIFSYVTKFIQPPIPGDNRKRTISERK